MNTRIIASALALATVMLGTGVTTLRADDHPAVVVVEDTPPTFIEEGATINGTIVVAPADLDDYVTINGAWYYYHPTLHTWVHVTHDRDWKPTNIKAHIYHKWSEHPMYHRK